jgi:hypothetical protein
MRRAVPAGRAGAPAQSPVAARVARRLDPVRLNSAVQRTGELSCLSDYPSYCGASATVLVTTLGYGHRPLPVVRVEWFVERRYG